MRRRVDILEVKFLSQEKTLLKIKDIDLGKTSQAMCDIPWFVKMAHWLVDNGFTSPPEWSKSGHDWETRIPAVLNVTTGNIVETVMIRTDEDFPLRDVLTVWTVMED